jgi:hypothetical protein
LNQGIDAAMKTQGVDDWAKVSTMESQLLMGQIQSSHTVKTLDPLDFERWDKVMDWPKSTFVFDPMAGIPEVEDSFEFDVKLNKLGFDNLNKCQKLIDLADNQTIIEEIKYVSEKLQAALFGKLAGKNGQNLIDKY